MLCDRLFILIDQLFRPKITTVVNPSYDDKKSSDFPSLCSVTALFHYPVDDAGIYLRLDQPTLFNMQTLHKHAERLTCIRDPVDAAI